MEQESLDLETFKIRGLHPDVFIGTASDRYAGWIGQIYSEQRYGGRIHRRTKILGGTSFVEQVLPVESVEEYFKHFRTLELDFTFYRPLLEEDGRRTSNYHLLHRYRQHLKKGDRLVLKVPQVVFAQKLWRAGRFSENEAYLNHEIFRRQFYEPALEILGPWLRAFIFEQEYQRKQDRVSTSEIAAALDGFFQAIPKDNRYHVELRTETYLTGAVFQVLAKHGVGQVLSHWTWLPSLRKQFHKSGCRLFNSGRDCIIRLMTPRGVRYEDAYARAHPFDALVEGMFESKMVQETAGLMWSAIDQGGKITVIVNNRAGGNAPLVAQQIGKRFLEMGEERGQAGIPPLRGGERNKESL
ncbi:MAG: DUF72 domain-containing protein [Syntrophobacteria bacterium]